ncbi:uncharacterized protein BP5553_02877 [Venustampulla echinocandica]|uniref:Uncharacterized protein n=1 Tax=Venustampulla echinocandica TaxID=2656787 RepID=A0A370TSN2_9HELO|nr:uncharacterized protein BP5553_02877 [Venustampulla echinocandica]RDL38537.1 hypothetical protein BP5553_02877 [Venustampulla echinocandica]
MPGRHRPSRHRAHRYRRQRQREARHYEIGGPASRPGASTHVLQGKHSHGLRYDEPSNCVNINDGTRAAPLGPLTDSNLLDFPASTSTTTISASKSVTLRDVNREGIPKLTETPGAFVGTVGPSTPSATLTTSTLHWTSANASNSTLTSIASPSTHPYHSFSPTTQNSIDPAAKVRQISDEMAEKVTTPGTVRSAAGRTTEAENQHQDSTTSGRMDIEGAEMAIYEAAAKFKALPLHSRAKMIH